MLVIKSPKRKKNEKSTTDGFFPYYAGFPERFVREVIESSSLSSESLVFDPWNGSGTTTYVSSNLGYKARGIDINPVMVIVARARHINRSHIRDLRENFSGIVKDLGRLKSVALADDPLLNWFSLNTATMIRNLERRIFRKFSLSPSNENPLDTTSILGAAYYVALFNFCKKITQRFRSTNPTWLRLAKVNEEKIDITFSEVSAEFKKCVLEISSHAELNSEADSDVIITLGDTTQFKKNNFADLILSSPPYCTRIDYTAATRIELALLHPLLEINRENLSRLMIGSIRVPIEDVQVDPKWGETCVNFLRDVTLHNSKASNGYYRKTHIDYFSKIYQSIENIKVSLKEAASAILVVQDSYYKEIHNDLPKIFIEMAENIGMENFLVKSFEQSNSLSRINPASKKYRRSVVVTESVLCFRKKD